LMYDRQEKALYKYAVYNGDFSNENTKLTCKFITLRCNILFLSFL
jgi:hypothetical protein